jgi:dienelactone hydrolase
MIGWVGHVLVLAAFVAAAAGCVTGAGGTYSRASDDGPAQTVYKPPKGKGPIVMVLSGQSGMAAYDGFSGRLASLGYYVVLLDGNDVFTRAPRGEIDLVKAIRRAQRAPEAIDGKVAAIGFSLGGAAALARASTMPDLVSTVIAYYPATSWVTNPAASIERVRVPVLILAAELDTYRNCCLIGTARAIEAAAKQRGAPVTLVVYPNAQHGFNIAGPNYRAHDDTDAWGRVLDTLTRDHRRPE